MRGKYCDALFKERFLNLVNFQLVPTLAHFVHNRLIMTRFASYQLNHLCELVARATFQHFCQLYLIVKFDIHTRVDKQPEIFISILLASHFLVV